MINPKNLHGKALAVYIWDYYRLPVIGCITALAVVIYALTAFLKPQKTTALTVVIIGAEKEIQETPEIFTAFEEEMLETEYEKLSVERIQSMGEAPARSLVPYIQILNARFLAGEIDLVLADQDTLSYVAGNGVFLDPRTYLTEEEENQLSPWIVTSENADGETVGIGISLEESSLFKETGLLGEDAAVGIAAGSRDPELAHTLIEYLFGLPYMFS